MLQASLSFVRAGGVLPSKAVSGDLHKASQGGSGTHDGHRGCASRGAGSASHGSVAIAPHAPAQAEAVAPSLPLLFFPWIYLVGTDGANGGGRGRPATDHSQSQAAAASAGRVAI